MERMSLTAPRSVGARISKVRDPIGPTEGRRAPWVGLEVPKCTELGTCRREMLGPGRSRASGESGGRRESVKTGASLEVRTCSSTGWVLGV